MSKYDRAFLTGCDHTGEWLLPWFFKNYRKHNNTPIVFADFGVKNINAIKPLADKVITINKKADKGWYKKPTAMIECPSRMTYWLDTDCHIHADIGEMFDLLVPNKLAMVEDIPHYVRRKVFEINSGVVGFIDTPQILKDWMNACDSKLYLKNRKVWGDQKTLLHVIQTSKKPYTDFINLIPEEYNVLPPRFDRFSQLNSVKKITHCAGNDGKQLIKKML